MKLNHLAALTIATVALGTGATSVAQTTTRTTTSTSATVRNGVPATTVRSVHVRKTKTHRARRVLGVKVGHHTRVDKTVRSSTTDAHGATSTEVTNVHK